MTNNIFVSLSDEFKKNKIPCVLIGGFAVNYYKVSRQTADIDFLIKDSDIKKIEATLKTLGYALADQQESFIRFGGNKENKMDIDFMIVDSETLEKIYQEGNTVRIAGTPFIIPTLTHLIALKLHSIKYNAKRELKDLPDIVNLIHQNGLDVGEPGFRDMCLKYGTPNLYQKIKEYAEKQ